MLYWFHVSDIMIQEFYTLRSAHHDKLIKIFLRILLKVMETEGNEKLPNYNLGKWQKSREVNVVLGATFPWGALQILEEVANRLRAKQYFLKLPKLRKTKAEGLPEWWWWVNPCFGLTSRRSPPRNRDKKGSAWCPRKCSQFGIISSPEIGPRWF